MTASLESSASEVPAPSVVIAVPNEVLAHGLEAVLRSAGVPVVRRLQHGADAALALRREPADYVLAAGDPGWLDGVAAAAAGTRAKILLIVDIHAAPDVLARTVIRADGYLAQQDLSAETLDDCLRRVGRGELPMPFGLAHALLDGARPPAPRRARATRLTDRERQALELLAEGLTNQQIARRLSISSHGAKRLVTAIMLKLDAPNRTAAVATALGEGIIESR
ncbi:response regulator transcription factor [Actinoallomurus sp. NPDC050550]|uniref:helix-turn-helix transcriptional regulator n=1 Tax=Actinoallomurus sp. NPDC050550 TaxID=3154937 RepID=UPI0033ED7060